MRCLHESASGTSDCTDARRRLFVICAAVYGLDHRLEAPLSYSAATWRVSANNHDVIEQRLCQ